MEYLKLLYGVVGARYPLASLIVVSLVGALVFGSAWWLLGKQYQKERTAEKYSSTQVIELSSEPGNYNDTLNLDNVATMVQRWDATHEKVGMVLTTSPPLRVDDPKAGTKYPSGPDWTAEFPAADEIETKSASFVAGHYFLFHRFKATTHIIEVGTRKFRVTLLDVRDKSEKKKKRMLIQYTFGISEE